MEREERRGKGREGRGGLSGHVAEEAFCLKSAPGCMAAVAVVLLLLAWDCMFCDSLAF